MSAKRVLVCGDRNWSNHTAIQTVLQGLDLTRDYDVIVHGAARGADSIAGMHAADLGLIVEEHPAKWDEHGRAAGPIRNTEMLKSGVDECWAFHNDLDASKGTRDMVNRCLRAGVPTYVVSALVAAPLPDTEADQP